MMGFEMVVAFLGAMLGVVAGVFLMRRSRFKLWEEIRPRIERMTKQKNDAKDKRLRGIEVEQENLLTRLDELAGSIKEKAEKSELDRKFDRNNIELLQSDLEELHKQLKNIELPENLEHRLGELEADIKKLVTGSGKGTASEFPYKKQLSDIEKKVRDVEGDIHEWNNKLSGVSTRLATLEQTNSWLSGSVQKLSSDMSALRDTFTRSGGDIEIQRKINSDFSNLGEGVRKNTEAIRNHETRLKDLEKQYGKKPVPPPPLTKILFDGTPVKIEEKLKQATDISSLLDFAKTRPDKDVFLRGLERYQKDLKKFAESFDFDDYAPGTLSEDATEAFAQVVYKGLLSNIIVSIHRGQKADEDVAFYREISKLIDAHLATCGIFTRSVQVGHKLQTADYEDLDVIEIKGTPQQKNIIHEVERLPYYMNYIEDGEVARHKVVDGKVVAFG